MPDHATPGAALAEMAARLLADAEHRVPLRQTLAGLAGPAAALVAADAATVSVVEGGLLRLVAATGAGLEPLERLAADDGGSPAARALAEGHPVAVDPSSGAGWVRAAGGAGWGSALAVPVTGRSQAHAVITLYRAAPVPFDADDLRVATAVAGLAATAVVLTEDRDAAVRAQQALARQALHDGLTGLANRTLLLDRLEHELRVSARRRSPLAVLFVDLDRFKEVNDSLGHAAGDQLLVAVAGRLTGALRAQDTVARLGGDEFVAVCADLPVDLPDEQVARHVTALADRLGRAVAHPTYRLGGDRDGPADTGPADTGPAGTGPADAGTADTGTVGTGTVGTEVRITASVGSVVASPDTSTAESLLREADTAMYRAKRRRAAPTIDLRSPADLAAQVPPLP